MKKADETFDARLVTNGLYETLAIKRRDILTTEKIISYTGTAIMCCKHKFNSINRTGSVYWLGADIGYWLDEE